MTALLYSPITYDIKSLHKAFDDQDFNTVVSIIISSRNDSLMDIKEDYFAGKWNNSEVYWSQKTTACSCNRMDDTSPRNWPISQEKKPKSSPVCKNAVIDLVWELHASSDGFLATRNILFSPGWDVNPSQRYPSIKFAGTNLYTWAKRGTVRVKCFSQEHSTMSPTRARPRTTWYRDERTDCEATALPNVLWAWIKMFFFSSLRSTNSKVTQKLALTSFDLIS